MKQAVIVVDVSLERFERYVGDVLQAPVHLTHWEGEAALPSFLRNEYEFYEGNVAGAPVLFLFSGEEATPSVVRKHQEAMRERWQGPIAFVFDRVTPYARQGMIRARVAFVVPESQLYLPTLGMDLRERFRAPRTGAATLRPSAQAALLHVLTGGGSLTGTPTKLAAALTYTPMAMGKALDQLEGAGLVDVRRQGRERLFRLAGEPEELWQRAQPLLANPVKRRRYLAQIPPVETAGLRAGLSALATYSSLAEPRVPVLALTAEQARRESAADGAIDVPSPEEAGLEVELWSYSPSLLSPGPAVDRLSLYLSLRDDEDERVQSALDEMMRGVRWSRA